MNKPLRERHLKVWLVMAVMLPLGFVSAYFVIPKMVTDEVDNYSKIAPLPVIVNTADDENFLLNFRQTSDQAILQMEIIIKKPLTVPSVVVYLSQEPAPKGLENLKLLGTLQSKGVYRFNFLHDIDLSRNYYLVFYDFIKKKQFHSLKIQ